MRPFVKSYGLTSTSTSSPGVRRIRFLRSFPAKWHSKSCPLSSFTRNVVAGKASVITPFTTIKSFVPLIGCSQQISWFKLKFCLSIAHVRQASIACCGFFTKKPCFYTARPLIQAKLPALWEYATPSACTACANPYFRLYPGRARFGRQRLYASWEHLLRRCAERAFAP